jgi:hypothetical protein
MADFTTSINHRRLVHVWENRRVAQQYTTALCGQKRFNDCRLGIPPHVLIKTSNSSAQHPNSFISQNSSYSDILPFAVATTPQAWDVFIHRIRGHMKPSFQQEWHIVYNERLESHVNPTWFWTSQHFPDRRYKPMKWLVRDCTTGMLQWQRNHRHFQNSNETRNVRILTINASTNLCTWKNIFGSNYKTPTCFGTGMPSSGSYLDKGV